MEEKGSGELDGLVVISMVTGDECRYCAWTHRRKISEGVAVGGLVASSVGMPLWVQWEWGGACGGVSVVVMVEHEDCVF